MNIVKLPDCELDIMLAMWDNKNSMRAPEILELLKDKHTWSISTLYTMLDRLYEKKFVSIEYSKRFRYYSAVISKEEYGNMEMNSLVQRLFGNSSKNFIASLINTKTISQEQFNELAELFDKGSGDEDS